MKLCNSCVHFIDHYRAEYTRCEAVPANPFVEAYRAHDYEFTKTARSERGACGPDAKLFKLPEIKESWLIQLLRLIGGVSAR